MADAITIKALQDASLDAKSLEEVVNGDEAKQVTTRKGETYPSVKKAIKTMFENGGLPAEPFSTKGAMESSNLSEGAYAVVTNSSNLMDNGLYIKAAGVWERTSYEPVSKSIFNKGVTEIAINPIYGKAIELLYPNNRIFDGLLSDERAYLKIDVSDAEALIVEGSSAIYFWRWVFRDADDKFISITPIGPLNGVFNVPKGAKWAYRNYQVADAEEFEGSELRIKKRYAYNVNNLITTALDTIQDSLDLLGSSIISQNVSNDLLALTDTTGTWYAKFDESGGLHLKDLDGTVQDRLNNIEITPETHNVSTHTYKRTLEGKSYPEMSDTFANLVNKSRLSYANTAIVPHGFNLTKYNTSMDWINSVKINEVEESDYITIRGYDPDLNDDIEVVHPQICTFKEKVAGYVSWMSITPYTDTNDSFEIPYIYGSNDPELRTWELIPTFPAPFEEDPVDKDGSYKGHLSDPFFTYDPYTGELILGWRESLFFDLESKKGTFDAFRARRYNGVEWSESYYIYPPEDRNESGLLSPSIIFNDYDGLFYLYYVSIHRETVMYCTAPDLWGNWSESKEANIEGVPLLAELWHIEVKIVGNKVVALLYEDQSRSSKSNKDNLFFAISDDFVNFKRGMESVTQKDDSMLYKASFEVEYLPNNQARFFIVYTTSWNSPQGWRLYISKSNIIQLGE